MAKELPLREEIDNKYKWNVDDIYESDNEWEEDLKNAKNKFKDITDLQGKLTKSGEDLLSGLETVMEVQEIIGRVYLYAHLKQDQNTGNQKYQGLYKKAQSLAHEAGSVTSFMVPAILTLSSDEIDKYIKEEQGLELYRQFLDNIVRQKVHYLSAEEEKILALSGEVMQGPNNIFSMLNDADMEFPVIEDENGEKIRITHGRFIDLLKKNQRSVRESAYRALYSRYREFDNTFASTLNTGVKSHIFGARARKYSSALEASLDDDNVSTDIYNNLIKTVKDNIQPMHDYVEMRKNLLGYDKLYFYDLYVPLVEEVEMETPFQEAKEMVKKGLKPLGDEYLNVLEEGFNSGWIDVYENKGKRSGAYSSGCYGVHPYVLLNYTKDINNVFTLAHEMGHALHTYYSNESQPFVYASYKIFVAEVASTLNETLLIHYLLQNTEEVDKKRYLINYYLEQFRGTVYRQTMFAEFEKIIHEKAEEGIPLTSEFLQETYRQLNQEYYGSEIILDDEIAMEWARIPHFYYDFYVYKYATGFSAATALAEKIIDQEEGAVDDYLQFLKSGNSDYPVNILKNAGVDMSSPQPIEKAVERFKEYVDKFTELS